MCHGSHRGAAGPAGYAPRENADLGRGTGDLSESGWNDETHHPDRRRRRAGVRRGVARPAGAVRHRAPDREGHLGRRRPGAAGRAGPARATGRPHRHRPADAGDDRDRAARAGAHARPDREVPAADGVRRHRGRDPGDQRHRPRPLPAQALGPARGAPLPRHRRPARRLEVAAPRARRRRAGGRAPVVRAQLRDQDLPGPQPRALPVARRGERRRGTPARGAGRGDPRRPAPGPGPRRGADAVARDPRRSPTAWACAPGPSSRSTTSASWAADRPGWPPPCTPRPRG